MRYSANEHAPLIEPAKIPGVWWTSLLILIIVVTPKLVLPGGIPFRIDDVMAFGALGLLVCTDVLRMTLRRPEWLEVILLLTAVYMLLDAVVGSPVGGSVGSKEYLDALRPLKFLAVFHVTRRVSNATREVHITTTTLGALILGLSLLALCQQFLLSPESDGFLASLSLLFKETEEQTRSYFGYRTTGTFGTPTDLAYVSTIILFGAVAVRDFPFRFLIAAAAAITIVLSGTRTFLFAGPAILLVAGIANEKSITSKVRGLLVGVSVVLIGVFAASFLLSAAAKSAIQLTFSSLLTLDFESDDSLRMRVLNFVLAKMTWSAAPWRGVVTRDFMRPEDIGGVDSEYLLTFHRYGLIGLFLLVATSWSLWRVARTSRTSSAALAHWLLLIVIVGLLYGVTQGALINTRIGTFAFVLAGLAFAHHESSSAHTR